MSRSRDVQMYLLLKNIHERPMSSECKLSAQLAGMSVNLQRTNNGQCCASEPHIRMPKQCEQCARKRAAFVYSSYGNARLCPITDSDTKSCAHIRQ